MKTKLFILSVASVFFTLLFSSSISEQSSRQDLFFISTEFSLESGKCSYRENQWCKKGCIDFDLPHNKCKDSGISE